MRVRRPIATLLTAAVLLVPTLAACGTATVADPSSTGATAGSSNAGAPTHPSGPTVTVPGLGTDASASATPASAPPTSPPRSTATTSAAGPVAGTTTKSSTSAVVVKSSTVDLTTTVTVTPPAPTTAPATTAPTSTAPTSTRQPAKPSTTTAPTTKADPPPAGGNGGGSMTRKTVVIDPGHNGQNNAHPEIITQQVPAGFGEMKNCNTTGTQTNDGYTESLFNWKTAVRLKEKLEAKGITVKMTRSSNDGVGPCVNERAAIGNDDKADLVISIHGDGNDDQRVHGFYVMTSERAPAGDAMAALSHRLAKDVRDGLVGDGLSPSNSLGSDGLWARSDLAGLNLSTRPTVMVEMGNMRSPGDAGLMSSSAGQDKIAAGLAAGAVAFLVSGG